MSLWDKTVLSGQCTRLLFASKQRASPLLHSVTQPALSCLANMHCEKTDRQFIVYNIMIILCCLILLFDYMVLFVEMTINISSVSINEAIVV